MKNVLLFNNIPYNRIIKKNVSNEHPYKNIFINVFILLFFIIKLGLFLSYRYRCKNKLNDDIIINDTKDDSSINDENDIIIEQNSDDIKEKKTVLDEKKTNNLLQENINQKNLLLDIQNNNFGNNLDNEDEQYKLI